ncbi:hypothetical protein BSKO_10958 [Bryopsis sp. KO-2023]|nr:hypothetical protein BSKO_10958 [Bryopsis sp. KO-2023]
MKTFRERFPFEERKAESDRIRATYPDMIPVIVEKLRISSLPDIDEEKQLILSKLPVRQFFYDMRQQLKSSDAVFIFPNSGFPETTAFMMDLYRERKDPDGFLYVTYGGVGAALFNLFEFLCHRACLSLCRSGNLLFTMPVGLFVFLFATTMWLGWYAFFLFFLCKMGHTLWNARMIR